MKTYCLVVHNSDEVKAVFVGDSIKAIIMRVMGTNHGNDIENRSLDYYNDDMREIAEEKDEGWVDVTELPIEYLIEHAEVLLERLYHDGDSQDGYTLFDTDLSQGAVLHFRHN